MNEDFISAVKAKIATEYICCDDADDDEDEFAAAVPPVGDMISDDASSFSPAVAAVSEVVLLLLLLALLLLLLRCDDDDEGYFAALADIEGLNVIVSRWAALTFPSTFHLPAPGKFEVIISVASFDRSSTYMQID